MNLSGWVHELQRRRVFRALGGYGIAAFAILQVVEPIMHGLHLPDWVLTATVVTLGLGFPVAVALAWVFDLTARGIERTPSEPDAPDAGAGPAQPPRGLRLGLSLVGIGILAATPGVALHLPSRRAEPATDRSVEVLPFANLSPEAEHAFFADGVHAEIITQLGRISGLRVIARSSVQQYREGALALQPEGPEAQAALGHLRYHCERDAGHRRRNGDGCRGRDPERLGAGPGAEGGHHRPRRAAALIAPRRAEPARRRRSPSTHGRSLRQERGSACRSSASPP